MRRGVVAAAVFLLCAAVAPPSHAGVRESAEAMWGRVRGSKGTLYVIFGTRKVGRAGVSTMGGIGKLPCKVRRGPTFRNVICRGKLVMKDLPPDAFVVHPLLEEARLAIKARGRIHRARWRARDEAPRAGAAPIPGPSGVTVYAHMTRDVRAGGRVLGRRLRGNRPLDFAELTRTGRVRVPLLAGVHRVTVEFRL